MVTLIAALARRLSLVCNLAPERAQAAVREVLDGLDQTLEEYIECRHDELKMQGLANDAIYETLLREISVLRFRAPRLTTRQIRRRIYG